jgi:catechol 2,3-dioxygenase-like lactoylglutathione lyase family enzyme
VVEIADPSTEDPSAGLVSHERLRVTDVDLSTDWYAALGWEVRARGDGAGDEPSWASLVLPEDPTFSLELEGAGPGQPAAEGSARPANAQGLYRIAIAVEDVATAHAELTATGAELPDPVFFPMPDVPTGGFTALFLRDPDGFTVELVDRPRSAVRRPTEPR